MDTGQTVQIICRLIVGTAGAFFAILLWARTRDTAWMLVIIGVITAYVHTVYEVLAIAGISSVNANSAAMSFLSIVLSNLPGVFFIAAFAVIVARKYRAAV